MSAGDDEPGMPAGRAPPCGRLDRLGVDPAARDHPGDHRVRVPHLARPELITTPYWSRDLCDQLEHAPRVIVIAGQSPRALHRLGDVWDVPSEPQANLVAEDSISGRPTAAYGATGDDAPLATAQIRDRRLFDDVGSLGDLDLERGVVEVACRTSLHQGRQRFVDATVEPDGVSARAEREPVEVDRGARWSGTAGERCSALCPHVASIASGAGQSRRFEWRVAQGRIGIAGTRSRRPGRKRTSSVDPGWHACLTPIRFAVHAWSLGWFARSLDD